MSEPGLLREVVDEVKDEWRVRWLQVLAAAAYIVVAAGGLYLFSSVGEDSRTFFDVHRRTTLAAVGTGLLVLGAATSIATLLVERVVRRRAARGREAVVLPNRRRLTVATITALLLAVLGAVAISRWS